MNIFAERPAGVAQFGRIIPPAPQWLARQPEEEVIEPALPIVDAHHHLWDVPGHPYLLHEYARDIAGGGHRIVASILVEAGAMYRQRGPAAMRAVGETEFARGMGAMSDSGRYGPTRVSAGIVGFADLCLGARIESVLQAHLSAAGGRFRGVRYGTGWDRDPLIGNSHNGPRPGQLGDADLRVGLAALQRLGLSFDALVYHTQLGELAELAETMPDLSIVLGHVGMPLGYGSYAGRGDEVFSDWRAGMAKVAKCPNVSVKLGGLVMRLAAFDYVALPAPPDSRQLARLWGPYIETSIELFGAERCMFESNFPVDRMGTGYRTLWNGFKRIASGASESDKRALFAGTALRIYRIEPTADGPEQV